MPIGEVLFVRGSKGTDNGDLEEEDDDDDWDDTDLVKAYDKAVQNAKAEVAQRLGFVAEDITSASESCSSHKENSAHRNKSRKKKKKKQRREWAIGDHCRARYSADGLYYEGTITSIHQAKGTCVIQFTGYGNEQEESVSLLLPSLGAVERRDQEIQAAGKDAMDMETSEGEASAQASIGSSKLETGFNGQVPPRPFHPPPPQARLFHDMVPPPPPLHITESLPNEESQALSAMLMSWYMSGFHTGYFQGLKRAQRKS